MKHIVLIALALFSFTAKGQIQMGAKTFSTEFELGLTGSHVSSNSYNVFRTAFTPGYSWFTSENTSVGYFVGAVYEIVLNNNASFSSNSVFLGNINRRYWPLENRHFGFFVSQASFLGQSWNSINPKAQIFIKLNFMPGAFLFIRPNLAIEFSFAEIFFESRPQRRVKNYGIGILNMATTAKFGLRYYFNSTDQGKRKAIKLSD